ncbi:MAG: DMT family transporter [Myxococcaceae bacterium]
MDTTAQGRLRADLALVAITALWGATFVVVKDALANADTFSFLAMRFGVGALVATVLAGRSLLAPGVLRYGALLSLFLFLGFALQTAGLHSTTESRSAFITGLAVILVPFVSVLFFRRWPQIPSLVGVSVAVLGLYVLTGGLDGAAAGGETLVGDLLTLGCAVTFAFHIALTERFAPRVPPVALVAVQLWGVCLLSTACLPFVETHVTWTGDLIWAVLFCGIFASALAISVQTWAQARTTAVRAALIFSLEPVFASSLSVVLGREELGQRELVGGLLTVLAVVIAEVGNAWLARRRVARLGPTSG